MDNSATQKVNVAVKIAADEATLAAAPVDNPGAYRHGVGKRIQGTYGAELRKAVDANPTLTAHDLYELIIRPAESLPPTPEHIFPAQPYKQSPGPFIEVEEQGRPCEEEGWWEGLAAAKAALRGGGTGG